MGERWESIKSKIKNLLNNKNYLTRHGIENDSDGYIYCITNSIINIYNEKIYKLGNTLDIGGRLNKYNQLYFEPIITKNIIRVPYKYMFECLLFIKLDKYRIRKNKEFFMNYIKIRKELKKIEELVKKNDDIECVEKYYEYIKEENNITEELIKNINLSKKKKYNIEPINYGETIKNNIKNYIPNNERDGLILKIEIPEIEYNFEGNVQVITVRENLDFSFTEFVGKGTIIDSIRVNDKKFTKLLIHDMLNNCHIKNKYFLCSSERVDDVLKKIKNYNESYSSIEKIKKKYLYDMYNEGEDVERDIESLDEIIEKMNSSFIYENYKKFEENKRIDNKKKKCKKEDNINVEEIFKRMNIISRYEKYKLNEDN